MVTIKSGWLQNRTRELWPLESTVEVQPVFAFWEEAQGIVLPQPPHPPRTLTGSPVQREQSGDITGAEFGFPKGWRTENISITLAMSGFAKRRDRNGYITPLYWVS